MSLASFLFAVCCCLVLRSSSAARRLPRPGLATRPGVATRRGASVMLGRPAAVPPRQTVLPPFSGTQGNLVLGHEAVSGAGPLPQHATARHAVSTLPPEPRSGTQERSPLEAPMPSQEAATGVGALPHQSSAHHVASSLRLESRMLSLLASGLLGGLAALVASHYWPRRRRRPGSLLAACLAPSVAAKRVRAIARRRRFSFAGAGRNCALAVRRGRALRRKADTTGRDDKDEEEDAAAEDASEAAKEAAADASDDENYRAEAEQGITVEKAGPEAAAESLLDEMAEAAEPTLQYREDVDELMMRLDAERAEFVQKEDYKAAAEISQRMDDLRMSQLDAETAVLFANQTFYKAFNTRDYASMKALWLRSSRVHCICIHPSHQKTRHVGYSNVCAEWRSVFKKMIRCRIKTEREKVTLRGSTAIVTCRERLYGRGFVDVLDATNVFCRCSKGWLLVHRHVSNYEDIDESWVQQLLPPSEEDRRTDVSDAEKEQIANQLWEHLGGGGEYGRRSLDRYGRSSREEDSDSSSDEDEESEDEERWWELANSTIGALRSLSQGKHITNAARIGLMQDIIREPQNSVLVRAYAMMLADSDDLDEDERKDAWNDFIDLAKAETKELKGVRGGKRGPSITGCSTT